MRQLGAEPVAVDLADAAGESAPDPVPNLLSTIATEEAVARFTAAGGRGLTLRLGSLYGPTAASARDLVSLVR